MDVAYDHSYTEEVTAPASTSDKGKEPEHEKESLNEEFQQAYKAISNSPWGARLGAFVGNVRKQGESYYETARKEYPAVAEQATKGFSELRTNIVNRTRALSLAGDVPTQAGNERMGTGESSSGGEAQQNGLLEKLRKQASERIAAIEAAEARADEYLVKFGTNIGNFLKDAVTIAPPHGDGTGSSELVFEAKGSGDQKKQIFTTRLDAQLHLLHTNLALFKTDPKTDSYKEFSHSFSTDKQTERIASDLDKYPELRSTMENLVPGDVDYPSFWTRYHFLRNELDVEEQKRKELLKGAVVDEEEAGWDEDDSEEEDDEDEDDEDEGDEDEDDEDEDDDEDDDDESEEESEDEKPITPVRKTPASKASTDTLQPNPKSKVSMEKSDSEASYDVVSGAPSNTPSNSAGSPPKSKAKSDDSSDEEEDWE